MSNEIKPIETIYNGYKFRSRLEARWAVFFDAMGIKYEYEPEGFRLQDGSCYLPDFRIYVASRIHKNPIYAEVKGCMTDNDYRKVCLFSEEYPILILGGIPKDHWEWRSANDEDYRFFSYGLIDGDEYCALFSKYEGETWLCGADHEQWDCGEALDMALAKARQARFEHGEVPFQEISPQQTNDFLVEKELIGKEIHIHIHL